MLLVTPQVRFLQSLRRIDPSPPHLDLYTVALFNLSTAKKLKHLVFRCARAQVQWITTTLQTVKSEDLQQITLWPGADVFVRKIGEPVRQQWQDLDHLLVQLWASHSIRLEILWMRREDVREYAPSLLPELIRSGLIDLAEH